MKLKDKCKPSIPPMEPDVYMAVCTMVIDLGQQYSEKFKKVDNKLLLAFDIPDVTIEVDGETKPRQLSQRYTYSSNPKGNLYKLLCSWLNKKFGEDELRELDLFSLLGRGCQIQVTLSEDGKRNNIENVMALPRGMSAPTSSNPYVSYDIDEDGFAGENWDKLPEWVRNIIEKSEQYQQDPPARPLDMPDTVESRTDAPPDEHEEVCPI